MIIAVDYAVFGIRRWNFVKCVIFPHFGQACVVAYLTLEMRSDYAKCVMVGKSEIIQPPDQSSPATKQYGRKNIFVPYAMLFTWTTTCGYVAITLTVNCLYADDVLPWKMRKTINMPYSKTGAAPSVHAHSFLYIFTLKHYQGSLL